ncbi:hypothetical protein WOLCODRAFT_21547 [Wolfiporia cocos MD-104 SS10]|uniref:F-box domain-containing protein n=1 Tax=Wolfiporia cocos (strain MD-104) TaxID=742152 RepID=A0A2H3JPG3_WOLCO|nr:hypothetical protein WOLCODRAFT_21547 [Wolfiporia cocos MD-104 SS10]
MSIRSVWNIPPELKGRRIGVRFFSHLGACVEHQSPSGPVPSRVPNAVWDFIIDELRDEPDTLVACMFVCKAWYSRSKHHLRIEDNTVLSGRDEVLRLARLARVIRPMHVGTISLKLTFLALSAAMFCGNVSSSLWGIALRGGEWMPGTPRNIFLHLSAFATVSQLELHDVVFPSIATFGRLVCALTGLTDLCLSGVSFSDARTSVPSQKRWATPEKLHHIRIDWSRSPNVSDTLRALSATQAAEHCQHISPMSAGDIPLCCIQDSSLQKVFDSAGDSLRELWLDLRHSLPEASLDDVHAQELVDAHMNVSHNTGLQALNIRTNLRRPKMHPRHLLWLPRLISHVPNTSIREVNVMFETNGDLPDGSLRLIYEDIVEDAIGLSQALRECAELDNVLSSAHYSSLASVAFAVRLRSEAIYPNKTKSERWTKSVSRLFPKLHKRGILRAEIYDMMEVPASPPWRGKHGLQGKADR